MNLCTLSRRPRAEGRTKCSNFGQNGRRDDRPFSIANNSNYGTQHNTNNRPSMHPFKGLKGNRGGSGLTSAVCRNSFDSDDPELEEIEFNKRLDRPGGFQSFSDDIDLNLDLEVEPIYSEPEFKNEPREFDFHIYDLLSVREGSYRCSLQAAGEKEGGKDQSSERRERLQANEKKSSEQGKEFCGGERFWGGGGGGQPQKSHHWSQLGLLSDPQVSQWSQLGGGQLSSDSDYASYDASVPLCSANGRGEAFVIGSVLPQQPTRLSSNPTVLLLSEIVFIYNVSAVCQ